VRRSLLGTTLGEESWPDSEREPAWAEKDRTWPTNLRKGQESNVGEWVVQQVRSMRVFVAGMRTVNRYVTARLVPYLSDLLDDNSALLQPLHRSTLGPGQQHVPEGLEKGRECKCRAKLKLQDWDIGASALSQQPVQGFRR
jgi:hypothetical protein